MSQLASAIGGLIVDVRDHTGAPLPAATVRVGPDTPAGVHEIPLPQRDRTGQIIGGAAIVLHIGGVQR